MASPRSDISMGKVPPQALDVERTVLGSMLIDPAALDVAMEILNDECFYASANRLVFTSMQNLFKHGAPVDVITLAEDLRKNSWLEQVGSESYLSELVENVATSANIAYHCKILESKATLRRLISTTSEIATECFEPDAESRSVLDKAEQRIFQIAQEHMAGGFERMSELVPRTFADIERYSTDGGPRGVMTGFTKLDEMMTGLHGGDLIIVAGRPGMGKTSFAMSIVANASAHNPVKTVSAVFSLEMSKDQLVQRLICSEARIDLHKMRSGKLSAKEKSHMGLAVNPLYEAPLFIDDTPAINLMEIRAKCRRLKARENLGVVVIDYLQLMSSVERTENRQQEISQISRGLKAVAKELNVPIIALSQLSRAVEQRGGDKRPQLSDLRESGAIEQDADAVLFVFREYNYNRDDESLKYLAEIIIGKQRNGPTGTVPVSFMPEFTLFGNLDETHIGEGSF